MSCDLNYVDYICSKENMKLIINEVSNNLKIGIEYKDVSNNISGPNDEENDLLFKESIIKIGRICSPSYYRVKDYVTPIVALSSDSTSTIPQYFSQLYVKLNSNLTTFQQLKGKRFAFNDNISLSGYYCLVFYLKFYSEYHHQNNLPFFSTALSTGSHYNSILALIHDDVDVICLDCVVVSQLLTTSSGTEMISQLKPIPVRLLPNINKYSLSTNEGMLGPNPSQPIVVSQNLSQSITQNIQNAFLQVNNNVIINSISSKKYLPVTSDDYQQIIELMDICHDVQIYEHLLIN